MKYLKGAILLFFLAVLTVATAAQVKSRTIRYQSTATTLHLVAQKIAPHLRAPQAQEPRRDVEGRELPPAGGVLPLISVIGFGALVGGIASAMKAK